MTSQQQFVYMLEILDAEMRESLGFNGCAFTRVEEAERFAFEETKKIYPGEPDCVPEGDAFNPWGTYRVVTMDGYSRGTVRVRKVRLYDLGA